MRCYLSLWNGEDERRKLLGENAVLQDAATRLNAEVRDTKDELRKYASAERAGDRARAGVEGVSGTVSSFVDSCLTTSCVGARKGETDYGTA